MRVSMDPIASAPVILSQNYQIKGARGALTIVLCSCAGRVVLVLTWMFGDFGRAAADVGRGQKGKATLDPRSQHQLTLRLQE